VKPSEAGKVPRSQTFFDLSDLAGPIGRWLALRLVDTPISPLHLTLAFAAAGLAAAVLFAIDRGLWLAALLLVVKSALDAADGGLARARQRPSRVGRFLDSDCDFVVNVAVYAGIAAGIVGRTGQTVYVLLAFVALVAGMLQVSLYNHYYVRYRQATGGDRTSRVSEDEPAGNAWDNPRLLAWLHLAYRLIYGWQDALVTYLERAGAPNSPAPSRSFMTAVGVLGLGAQLLAIALCALLGHPEWALWLIAFAFSAYAAGLLLSRRSGP
jgi:phosphatidylglycerophosphate synthase